MTDDARDLLVEIAPEPSRRVDVDAIVKGAHRRRRRGRTLTALAGVLVVAIVAAGIAALAGGGEGSSRFAVRAGGPGLTVPDGWTPLTVDGGISLAIPPGWSRYPQSTSTHGFVVGSATPPDGGSVAACSGPPGAIAGPAGTWVVLAEFPAGSTSVKDSFGGSAGPIEPRPADFRTGFGAQGTCGSETLTSTTVAVPAASTSIQGSYRMTAFTDGGRVFLARVVAIGTGDQAQELSLGGQVLDTLHVDPSTAADATTTTGPATTTTTIAGVPPGVTPKDSGTNGGAAINDPQADADIRKAFLGWLEGKNLDQAAPYVDDFASIRDAESQGFAQHTPDDIAGFDGRVESVVIADPKHADVIYTLLHDGQPMYANRPGKAVKVDGKWKVTRDTACALLSMGGITCPARTTPTP